MSLLSPIIAVLVSITVLFGMSSVEQAAPRDVQAQDQEWSSRARIVSTLPGSETLAVAEGDSLHISTGDGWESRSVTLPEGELAMSGGDPATLLAGDKAECMRGGPGRPLHRSVDGGMTWEPIAGSPEIQPLAIWAADGLAIGASCTGLELSVDGGQTWDVLPGIDPGWDVTAFSVVPQSDDTGPLVLVGLTGEGGTSYLHSIDLSDPAAAVVSDQLRMYYAIGGLAGVDDTFVLAAMDGAWISTDAGATWERSADGLEGIVLEQDPAEHGLPVDVDPREAGLTSVVVLPDGGLLAGSADGLYAGAVEGGAWTKVDGTAGRVDQLAVSADGTTALYRADEVVREVAIAAT
jgi:hypothetical protein